MSTPSDQGTCEHCGTSFPYQLIHNGLNESAFAYCDSCGITGLLDGWKLPQGVSVRLHQEIPDAAECMLEACKCGGKFSANASPRCPQCLQALSALDAAKWIEANAAGTAAGWRWQRNWKGLYCIIVAGRVARNNWIGPARST